MQSFKKMMLGALALAALPGAAMAADLPQQSYTPAPMGAWYLRGDIGTSWLNWSGEHDNALVAGGGLGYDFGNGLRTDLRGDWTGHYSKNGESFATQTLLANAYYDFQVSDIASPYVGLGAGWGLVKDVPGDDSGFTVALMAGLNLKLTDAITADVGYRFTDIMLSGSDVSDHAVLAGVRYKF